MSKPKTKIEASTSGKSGTIRIVDYISAYSEASSAKVRDIVDDFIAKGIDDTEVFINTRGGSVVEAQQMVYELSRLPKVTLQIGAVAASAGTYPATKFYTKAYPNSQIMIHKPKIIIDGNEDQVEADLTLIKNTTQDYRSSYAKKMKKTEEEINALWDKGDYWMNGTQAKEIGLVDELMDESVKITSEDIERLVAAGSPNIPKNEDKTETEHTMKNRNQIIAALKLPADATDEQIEQAAKDVQAKADQVDTLTAAQKDAVKKEAGQIVDKAILDKKITADTKEKWLTAAENNLENTKAILEAMPGVQKPTQEAGAENQEAKGREKWTMEDYQTKDPEALATMMTAEPEKFEKLQADYFGK